LASRALSGALPRQVVHARAVHGSTRTTTSSTAIARVGRIYLVQKFRDQETWFWGGSFDFTGHKSYGRMNSRDGAMAAFREEYERWLAESSTKPSSD
jgi:hypothetical protein